MARFVIKVDGSKDIRSSVTQHVQKRLARNTEVRNILRKQAVARIENSGDSEITYDKLWDNPDSYRHGDKPLFDTGALSNGLRGEITKTFNGVRIGLLDSVGYGLKHQEGFVNKAPFPIPLTRRAANVLRKGGFRTMEETGLKEGKDFILQFTDTTVPARPIFNMAPENLKELADVIGKALTKKD